MSANRTNQQANGLYPIIRRVRRPLLPVEPAPESKPVVVNRPEESKAAVAVMESAHGKTDAETSNS
jgi:hypothetical protein